LLTILIVLAIIAFIYSIKENIKSYNKIREQENEIYNHRLRIERTARIFNQDLDDRQAALKNFDFSTIDNTGLNYNNPLKNHQLFWPWVDIKKHTPKTSDWMLVISELDYKENDNPYYIVSQARYFKDSGWMDWCGDFLDEEGLIVIGWLPFKKVCRYHSIVNINNKKEENK